MSLTQGMDYLDSLMQVSSLESYLDGRDETNIAAWDMPVHVGAFPWEQLDPERRDIVLGGILRNLVTNTKRQVPYYRDHPLWREVVPSQITTLDGILELPVIVKDTMAGTNPPLVGFRDRLIGKAEILVPDNVAELMARQKMANPNYGEIQRAYRAIGLDWWTGNSELLPFESGGTQGNSSRTLLPYLTVELESWALARALKMNGFEEGQSIACLYHPFHKGGVNLQRAADIMGMQFYSQVEIFNWVGRQGGAFEQAAREFGKAKSDKEYKPAEKYYDAMREGIAKFLVQHNINVVEGVQPEQDISSGAKGSGLTFYNILQVDEPGILRNLEHAFLTGMAVPRFIQDYLAERGVNVSTTLGKGEAMAGATSGELYGPDINNQTMLYFPTLELVANIRDGRLVRAQPGKDGVVWTTNLSAVATTLTNFAMDYGTAWEQGVKKIRRLFVGGKPQSAGACASGVGDGR
jgi:hypothetical protein